MVGKINFIYFLLKIGLQKCLLCKIYSYDIVTERPIIFFAVLTRDFCIFVPYSRYDL